MDIFNLYAEQVGRGKIEVISLEIGNDLLVAIWGGHRPHIGATAIAIPSITAGGNVDASTSVCALVGHKEDGIVHAAASKICRALQRKVVVTAGIHFDDITADEIDGVIRCTDKLIDRIIADNGPPMPGR